MLRKTETGVFIIHVRFNRKIFEKKNCIFVIDPYALENVPTYLAN